MAGTGEWSTHLEAAIAQAELDQEAEAGFEASNAFVAAHMLAGDRVVARRGAARAARIAQRMGRRRWEEQFTITANFLALLAGRCSSVAVWGRDFVRPHLTTAVHIAYAAYALALADLGSTREALRVLTEGRAIPVGDDTGLSLLRWAEAETHWLGGAPDAALLAAELCAEAGGQLPDAVARASRPCVGAVRPGSRPRSSTARAGRSRVRRGARAWESARSRPAIAVPRSSTSVSRPPAAADVPRHALRAHWGIAEAVRLSGDAEPATRCWSSSSRKRPRTGCTRCAGAPAGRSARWAIDGPRTPTRRARDAPAA